MPPPAASVGACVFAGDDAITIAGATTSAVDVPAAGCPAAVGCGAVAPVPSSEAAIAGSTDPLISAFWFFPRVLRALRVAFTLRTATALMAAVVFFALAGVKPSCDRIGLVLP